MTDSCEHNWAFLEVYDTRVVFTCTKCTKEMEAPEKEAAEIRVIVRKELKRIMRAGIKQLLKGAKK